MCLPRAPLLLISAAASGQCAQDATPDKRAPICRQINRLTLSFVTFFHFPIHTHSACSECDAVRAQYQAVSLSAAIEERAEKAPTAVDNRRAAAARW